MAPLAIGLSRALREARTRTGLTALNAAKKVGVHFVTLYAWENETRADKPSDASLEKAARVYNTAPRAILRRAEAIASELGTTPATPAAVSTEDRAPRATRADKRADTTVKNGPRRSEPASGGADVPRLVFTRVLRVLADLSDEFSLPADRLAAAQQALTDPGLIRVFASLSDRPLSNEDMVAAVDAAGAAVRSFVAARIVHGTAA